MNRNKIALGGIAMMQKKLILLVVILMGTLSLPLSTRGIDAEKQQSFKPEVKTLALFKNGLGFFVREGEATLKDGWVQTEIVPGASLGTLWITPLDKDAALDSAVSYRDESSTTVTATDLVQLIKANIGKRIIIRRGEGTIDGIIKSLPEPYSAIRSERRRYSTYSSESYEASVPLNPSLVIIETKTGIIAMNVSSIGEAMFPESLSTEITSTEKVKKMKFKINTDKDKVKLALSYLQKGISWMPGYSIDIEDPAIAKISMNATIINDAEDLKNSDVYLVVGYPHFAYSEVLSPMSLQQSLAEFISAITTGIMTPRAYDAFANITTQAITMSNEDRRENLTGYSAEAAKGLPGESQEDLFFYHRKDVSLQKGERGYYSIFSDSVKYSHVYEWEIPDLVHIDSYGRVLSSRDAKEEREQVWHVLKLINSTNYPWTTAPAFTVNGWKPMGQDKISYTPKGATAHLKLTIASDIKTDRNENEVSRSQVKVAGDDFDLIVIRGTISIKNYKSQDVLMEIKKDIVGEVLSVTHNGDVKKNVEGLTSVNPRSLITWKVPVKAGENIAINYRYQVYKNR